MWFGRPYSVVGVGIGYGLDDRGGRSSGLGRDKILVLSTSFRPALWPTQPPIEWLPRAPSPGVKRSGLEADHSPLTTAEVKNTRIYTFTPYISIGLVLN
jgi:hypothetical protein